MRDAPAAAKVVVLLGQSFATLELMETALRDNGHLVLATTRPQDVSELARSVQIDVLVVDFGDTLAGLEEEVRLAQPDIRVVRIGDPDELQRDLGGGGALARPVSLDELETLVGETTQGAWRCRARRTGPAIRSSGYRRGR